MRLLLSCEYAKIDIPSSQNPVRHMLSVRYLVRQPSIPQFVASPLSALLSFRSKIVSGLCAAKRPLRGPPCTTVLIFSTSCGQPITLGNRTVAEEAKQAACIVCAR